MLLLMILAKLVALMRLFYTPLLLNDPLKSPWCHWCCKMDMTCLFSVSRLGYVRQLSKDIMS